MRTNTLLVPKKREEKEVVKSSKLIYFCKECGSVTVRHRLLNQKPYVKWCCKNKMVEIKNRCGICKRRIRGDKHFNDGHWRKMEIA